MAHNARMTAEPSDALTSPGVGWVPDLPFGARLALVRQRLRLNQKEAAALCGIPQQSWRNWESGRFPHDLHRACRLIADRTGCDFVWLISGVAGGGHKRRYSTPHAA